MYITINKKHIVFSLIICFVLACSICLVYNNIFASKTNWGLSFKEQGLAPSGNATTDFLKQYNSYYIGNTEEKKVYLTFDAGYEDGYMPQILDALKNNNVKATFFLVSNFLKTDPDLVKRMVNEGHIVGNHTTTHPNMSKMSTMEDFKAEIEPVEELYKQITGEEMKKFYRPPQGVYSEDNLKMANELGYKTIFWSLAYVDWYKDNQPSKDEAFNKLIPRLHNGAIILLHSTSKTNAEILDELIKKIKDAGYEFSTLEELVNN
jgi:peptidoglycan-N-acetylmuramic acid deacetylase